LDIHEQIKNYRPYNEQEERDQVEILHLLNEHSDLFNRKNAAVHMTASAWVVNHDRSKVLMVYHNIYDSWSWMGGHADGDMDLHTVAQREVLEESSLNQVNSLSEDIFSMEILTVDGHEKKGHYVSSHLHLNITYLFEADEHALLACKPDENCDVAWFGLDEGILASSEPWFREHIYKKLNEKLLKQA
jgi:8-oxo-dGTP pyrophosphatase MutT (NUDIX family)